MKKSDGSYRILTDFRALNKHVVRSYQPLQGVQEMLSIWHGCKYYSKLDLQKGFYQTPLDPSSRHKTATSIPGVAFFQYCASPLGLSSSPTFFQSLVEKVFMGLKQSVVVCYLDDALSGSKTFDEMCDNLRKIFNRIRESKMLLNPKKCELFLQELKFLGYIINSSGIKACPEKIAVITKMTPPNSVKTVRSFLGLTGFFRKWVKDYSKICEPLTRLTKKNAKFKWEDEQKEAWQTIKDKLVESPILAHPDLKRRFTLIIDASNIAAGGILAQKDESGKLHPIAYGSTVLNTSQRNWSVHQRELYALIYFCEKYQSFLLGSQFDVITDNTTLLHLDKLKDIQSQRLWRWFEKLQKYDYKITYSPSKSNPSDALSRLPRTDDDLANTIPPNCEDVMAISPQDMSTESQFAVSMTNDTIKDAQKSDSTIITVKEWIAAGQKPDKSTNLTPELKKYYNSFDRLKVENDVLYRHWQPMLTGESAQWLICIPKELQMKIIELSHSIPASGHLGSFKTLERIRSRFYFPRMNIQTDLFIKACHVCHKKSRPRKTLKAPITAVSGMEPGHIVHYDIMENLPNSNGYHAILVIVDSFTKWTEAVPLRDTKAETIARIFLNTWISRQGIPCILHSDRGGNVDSATILGETMKMLNITKTRNFSYRPQSNGVVERLIGTIKNMLWKFCQENPKDWINLLDQVMFAYRTSIHTSTGHSPFFMDKGRSARIPMDVIMGTKVDQVLGETYSQTASNLYHKLQNTYNAVTKTIQGKQDYSKKRYDENAVVKHYKVGDWIYVWKPTPAYCKYKKFYDNFRGPFEITAKVGDHGYEIDLGSGKRDIVHMEHLKAGEKPKDHTVVDLNDYFGDNPEPETDVIEDGPTNDEISVEINEDKSSQTKKKPTPVIFIPSDMQAARSDDGHRPVRDRRQHIPYQHIV